MRDESNEAAPRRVATPRDEPLADQPVRLLLPTPMTAGTRVERNGTSFACATCSATWLSALERTLLNSGEIAGGGHRMRRRGDKAGEGPG
jgi:hypothetical protein